MSEVDDNLTEALKGLSDGDFKDLGDILGMSEGWDTKLSYQNPTEHRQSLIKILKGRIDVAAKELNDNYRISLHEKLGVSVYVAFLILIQIVYVELWNMRRRGEDPRTFSLLSLFPRSQRAKLAAMTPVQFYSIFMLCVSALLGVGAASAKGLETLRLVFLRSQMVGMWKRILDQFKQKSDDWRVRLLKVIDRLNSYLTMRVKTPPEAAGMISIDDLRKRWNTLPQRNPPTPIVRS